jgi:phosphohistidine swiveling domain-containing protein
MATQSQKVAYHQHELRILFQYTHRDPSHGQLPGLYAVHCSYHPVEVLIGSLDDKLFGFVHTLPLFAKRAVIPLGLVRARVAQTLAEASEVQPEEILIVPVIDVGWTPSFATIGGFASEVGAALSHGAVVAREYGIPTVVNLRNAIQTFRTGDLVELDADHGVLRRISEA